MKRDVGEKAIAKALSQDNQTDEDTISSDSASVKVKATGQVVTDQPIINSAFDFTGTVGAKVPQPRGGCCDSEYP